MIRRKDNAGQHGSGVNKEVCFTLNATDRHAVSYLYKVRRLTPTECERLQGLPDDWTAGGSDTARYKAIGNGMAQPCADFIISGIARALNEKE